MSCRTCKKPLRQGSIDKLLLFWLMVLLLFGGAMTIWFAVRNMTQPPPVASGQDEVVDYGPPLEKFELTASTGDQFESRELDGQVWIASFFYSSCPSVCVQQNLKVQELQQEFGRQGVKFLSITCDAETDTPSRLQEYAQRFGANPDQWIFLTGEQRYIEKVGNDIFRLPINQRGHSERLMVIDRQGEIRGAFHYSDPLEIRRLKQLVGELLKEPAQKAQATAEAPSEEKTPDPSSGDAQLPNEAGTEDSPADGQREKVQNAGESQQPDPEESHLPDQKTEQEIEPTLPSFSLTASTGEPFHSKDLKGRVWIASFFFTNCPSVCVKQNLAVRELEQQFGRRGVKFVSITCDANTDTPARLAEYARRMGADPESWVFLTGEQKHIEAIGKEILQLPVTLRGHSERLRVIDRQGQIRGAFHFADPLQVRELKQLVDNLLAEKPAKTKSSEEPPAETDRDDSPNS